MKLETLADKVNANQHLAKLVTVQHTPRKAVFSSAHDQPILKIAVMAHAQGFSYEIAHQTNGLLGLTVTYRPICVTTKHELEQTFHGVIRDTDA